MAVIKGEGPLPDGHPFKGMHILFVPRSHSSPGPYSPPQGSQLPNLQSPPGDPALGQMKEHQGSTERTDSAPPADASADRASAVDQSGALAEASLQAASEKPWYFDVYEYGTIVDPAYADPKVRREVFILSTIWIDTPQELIQEVERCYPLCARFQELTAQAFEEIQDRLYSEELDDRTRRRLERLEAVFADEDDGWKAWVRYEGKRDLPRLLEVVEDWLDEPIHWNESNWFPYGWGGQGHALSFFEALDNETLDALDIDIVLGDHPGSTYYAAELPGSIEEANAVAERLGLPFRFRRKAT